MKAAADYISSISPCAHLGLIHIKILCTVRFTSLKHDSLLYIHLMSAASVTALHVIWPTCPNVNTFWFSFLRSCLWSDYTHVSADRNSWSNWYWFHSHPCSAMLMLYTILFSWKSTRLLPFHCGLVILNSTKHGNPLFHTLLSSDAWLMRSFRLLFCFFFFSPNSMLHLSPFIFCKGLYCCAPIRFRERWDVGWCPSPFYIYLFANLFLFVLLYYYC